MTRILISLSARNQAWFNKLPKDKQSEYLKAHPKSKFGRPASGVAVPPATKPAKKPASSGGPAKHFSLHTQMGAAASSVKAKDGNGTVSKIHKNKLAGARKHLRANGFKRVGVGHYKHENGDEVKLTKHGENHAKITSIKAAQARNKKAAQPKTAKEKKAVQSPVKLKAQIDSELKKFHTVKTPAAKKRSFERLKALREKMRPSV
jgi:antitoxin (DNA-binding transcriptional repressor) of toxin-antitoxin stability system